MKVSEVVFVTVATTVMLATLALGVLVAQETVTADPIPLTESVTYE